MVCSYVCEHPGNNVWIHDCNIWCQDDTIAVKKNSKNMIFERIRASGVGMSLCCIARASAKGGCGSTRRTRVCAPVCDGQGASQYATTVFVKAGEGYSLWFVHGVFIYA